jgi:hypothetical protein
MSDVTVMWLVASESGLHSTFFRALQSLLVQLQLIIISLQVTTLLSQRHTSRLQSNLSTSTSTEKLIEWLSR